MSAVGAGEAVPAGLHADDVREMLDRQTEMLEMVAGAAPLRDVLTRLIVSLERLMPGARCSVLLLDRDRGTLHHGAAPSLADTYVAAIDGMAIGDGQGSCGTAAALDVPVVAVDVRTDPRWVDFRGVAAAAGLRSCWSTPIEGRDGRPVGTFAVYHLLPHRPSVREHLLVERFTHLASVAIGHSGLIRELVDSEERFRRSFDANALGMAIVGPDRRVTTSNRALSVLAGGVDLTGREVADLLAVRHGSFDACLEALGRPAGTTVVVEALLRRDRLPDVEVEVTVSRLHARADAPERWVVNVLDLTERREAERHQRAWLEAETARRTAEQLSHAKSELLAALGHEARTPIQAIVGFAELLGTMELDETRRRAALGHIDAAAGHVMDLLADVLDLSRLEAGALPLALEPVPLRDVAAEVLGLLSTAAERRDVGLAHALGDEVVLADRRRLRQVLLNLVGNAVRHGVSGGCVEVRPGPTGEGWVSFSVDDDGPGIPPDLLPRLFSPFVHAGGGPPATGGGEEVRGEGSIGLGLGLAHGLVAAMGGALTVGASTPAGTSMVVRLRAAPPA